MVDNHLAKESCKKRKRSCDPKAQAKEHCVAYAFWHNNDNFGYALNDIVLIMELSRNVQSENTQNLG